MGNSAIETEESTECPTCGRDDFKNARGMKYHHKVAHGESIAGILTGCSWCGDALRVAPGNYRKCERHFCKDKNCRSEWLSTQTGEDAPSWGGGKRTYECPNCGNNVKRKPANTHGDNVFCNRDCYTSWKSVQMRGPGHFNWKGGYSRNRGTNWPKLRAKALKADGYRCQGCGITEDAHRDAHGVGLSVHHIHPVTSFDDPADADTVDNLVSLCRACHDRWEGVPLRPRVTD